MQGITERISNYIAQLSWEKLPENVLEQTKLFIADYYAACIAGYRINTILNKNILSIFEKMGGLEESTILFSDIKLPAGNAAFLNAIYAHGADMDDGNRKAAGHIGAHVISAVFALAETINAKWSDVFVAINAGYDLFNRVVGAAQPGLYNKGLHSTGIGGGIACAAACAKLLGLGADGIYNAISLGAVQSSGLILIDESGQGCKPINPANAARTGILSAQLAQLGTYSPRNPLESKKGWFNAFTSEVDEHALLNGMGQTFTICESYLKLYPTCRHTHCCIEAALSIREKLLSNGFSLSSIKSITVFIYPSAIKSAGQIPYPQSVEEAKFSIHYCVAVALVRGKFGLEELNVQKCHEVNDFTKKITLVEDVDMEKRDQGIRGAKLRVEIDNGVYFEQQILIPRGEPRKPLDWQDIVQKTIDCAAEMYDMERVHMLIENVRGIDYEEPFRHCCPRHL